MSSVIQIWNVNVNVIRYNGGRRLRVFENMVLRRIFGSEREEVTGERRKLQYEELFSVTDDRLIG
jgi:hypothetical protein